MYGLRAIPFAVVNPWFAGNADVTTYQLEELLGTKLRALYQRRKGRDLFDLWLGLQTVGLEPQRVVECFLQYMNHSGLSISRAQFEANLSAKLTHSSFLEDIRLLIPADSVYNPLLAAKTVQDLLIAELPDRL